MLTIYRVTCVMALLIARMADEPTVGNYSPATYKRHLKSDRPFGMYRLSTGIQKDRFYYLDHW